MDNDSRRTIDSTKVAYLLAECTKNVDRTVCGFQKQCYAQCNLSRSAFRGHVFWLRRDDLFCQARRIASTSLDTTAMLPSRPFPASTPETVKIKAKSTDSWSAKGRMHRNSSQSSPYFPHSTSNHLSRPYLKKLVLQNSRRNLKRDRLQEYSECKLVTGDFALLPLIPCRIQLAS
jgi:hypothetical protein